VIAAGDSAGSPGAIRRRRQLALFGVAALALAASAGFAFHARAAVAAAEYERAEQRFQLEQTRIQFAEAERRAEQAAAAGRLIEQAAASGWTPGDWGERRIALRQTRLPREAVEELLQTTAREPGRIFGADEFDLSVTRMDEGLFESPDAQAQPLQLTLRGAHFFRTRD
jgi:hypothetical protein